MNEAEPLKVAVVADVHVGNHKRFGGETVGSINTRCRLTLDTLDRALDFAEEEECTHFVIAGDLFDVARPEPPVIAEVQAALERKRDMKKYILVGNHDRQSHHTGDNALAPLRPVARIVERPLRIVKARGNLLLVPHQPGDPHEWLHPAVDGIMSKNREEIEKKLKELGKLGEFGPPQNLLVLHMGIKDDKTPPWLQASSGAVHVEALQRMLKELRIGHALAGDWHEYRLWKGESQPGNRPLVVQIGALCPTGWDNPGTKGYGSVMIWEPQHESEGGSKLSRYEVPGPRFVKVMTTEDRDKVQRQARQTENTFFVSESAMAEESNDRMREAQTFMESHKQVAGWEVVPDKSIAQAEAHHAASLARSADTFDQALDAFIKAMPLDDDINRARITERCKEYLKP